MRPILSNDLERLNAFYDTYVHAASNERTIPQKDLAVIF